MKKSKLLLILALVVVLALGVLVSCKAECAHENYGAWQITKVPTLTDAGEAVRVCPDCSIAETTSVAKLSDTSVWTPTTTSATHTAAGKTTYTSTYGTVEISVDRLVDHVYDKEVVADAYLVSAADCTHAAVYRKSCVCGAVDTATFTSGSALGHKGNAVAAVEAVHNATTLKNGTKAHFACERCGLLFSDEACTTEVTAESLVVAVAHNYGGWSVVSQPTCTANGSLTHKCLTCGKVENSVIVAHDHDYTSGKMVLVTDQDVYQDDDGSIVEGDEEATEYHAPVCDICNLINKDAKVEHEYTDVYRIEETIKGNPDYHTAYLDKHCVVCGYIKRDTNEMVSRGSLENTWTKGETVEATYVSDGYTEYTYTYGSDVYKVKLPIAKHVAPYEGKTYNALQVARSAESNSITVTARDTINLAINSVGAGKSDSSPFRGDVVITMSDADINEVTITVTNGASVNTYLGYVEPLTGIIVISDNSFVSDAYVVVPYGASMYLINGSQWANAMAMSYHIDCGVYTGHDVTIFVNDDVVYFGVTFEDANGARVAANDCYAQDVLVVKSGDKVIATYVKNVDGELQLADAYLGEYKAVMDIDNTPDSDIGKIVVDGMGGYVLVDADNTPSGTYQAVLNNDGELDYFDVYVIVEGRKVAHYHATFVADAETPTIKLVAQTITITLNAGEQGTVEQITDPVYSNCVVKLPVPTANDNDAIFVRWMNGDVAVTATTTFTSDVTLNAVWATSAQLTIINGDSTDEKTISVITPIKSVLPEYVEGETVNSANNTIFAGWYTTADFSGNTIDDELTPGEEAVTVYAKWDALGTWTIVGGNYNFVYDTELGVWKSDNWHVQSSNAILKIIANGKIFVSFDYAASSEGGSYDKIYAEFFSVYTSTSPTTISYTGSKVTYDKMEWKTYSGELTVDQAVQLRYYKDNGGDHNEDRGFIRNLKINGRSITLYGAVDFLEGTYTCDGNDDLVLNGYGAYTWGDKAGTYVKTASNVIGLYVVENDVNTEYYVVTLDGTTYSTDKPDVEVSYNFGEINHSLTASTTNANIAFTLPTEGLDVEGFVFRGWYDNADFTGNAITSIIPTTDTVVYAKYDAAITLTYDYQVDGVENKVVTTLFANDQIGTLESIGEITNGALTFIGWFTLDGTNNEWGDEVTANMVLTDNTTVYAKWMEANVLFGTWKGSTAVWSGFSSTIATLSIDALGNVTTSDSTLKGSAVQVSEAGEITLYKPASGRDKEKTFAVNYDTANGYLVITGGSYPYVLTKVDNTDVAVAFRSSYIVKWSEGKVDEMTVGTGDNAVTQRFVLVNDTTLVLNPAVIAVDVNGNSITEISSYKTKGALVTVAYNDATVNMVYNGSDFVTSVDDYRGIYTDATRGNVILDGVGNIWIGTENTITGTYTEVATGKVGTTISKVYYEVVLNNDNTCVVAAPTAEVTYVVEHGTIEGTLTVNVGIKVEFTLPTVTPDTGYQFVGWYLSTDTSFTTPLTKHTLQSTDAISIVAKIDAMPTWASMETAETTTLTNGMVDLTLTTTSLNQVYYVKLELEAGKYSIQGKEATRLGGAQTGNGYARYALLDSQGNFVSLKDSSNKSMTSALSFGTTTFNAYSVTIDEAGTYYIQVSLGGKVVQSSYNYDCYGTMKIGFEKVAKSADEATVVAVGSANTVTKSTLGVTYFAVQVEAGKKYQVTCTVFDRFQLKVYGDSSLATSVANTAWIDAGQSGQTSEFTVENDGTYYIAITGGCEFTVVEVA